LRGDAQLSSMAEQGARRLVLRPSRLLLIGYYAGEEILACEEAGITVYLSKATTSGAKAKGRFRQAGLRLSPRTIPRRTSACQACALKSKCTTGQERRISRWEHEAVLETVQARLDRNPDKMRVRRQSSEHPFGTIKSWMGSTHFHHA